jgi:hypothetical protein
MNTLSFISDGFETDGELLARPEAVYSEKRLIDYRNCELPKQRFLYENRVVKGRGKKCFFTVTPIQFSLFSFSAQ